VHNIKKTF